jgi:glucosamine-6-phosphate deaminase
VVFLRAREVEHRVAGEIAGEIRRCDADGRSCRIGISADPVWSGVWQELVRLAREEGLSFRHVEIYNLSEYYPMEATHHQSRRRRIVEDFLDQIDVPRDQVHLLDGTVPPDEVDRYCAEYAEAIATGGGLDLALPAVSSTGHVEMNGAGSGRSSRTGVVNIDRARRVSLAADFFGTENVPRQALAVGLETILSARRIVTVQLGTGQAAVVARLLEGDGNTTAPVMYLREHPAVTLVLDESAAGELTRYRTPWRAGPIEWTATMIRRAVTILAETTGKAILKLTEEDYNDAGLHDLLAAEGSVYDINIRVFRAFQGTITGWPGGKPEQPGAVFPKTVLIFSPHPDDDVISMGGTLIRLADQGHEVHIAYQTSGNIAVFDEDALGYTDFVRDFCEHFGVESDRVGEIDAHVDRFLRHKEAAEIDSDDVLAIKGLIRRNEARAAARCCGVPESNLHFQDLPFYHTGTIRKNPISEDDLEQTVALLRALRPHQIYAAGDLSDPHGTHRTCLRIVLQALLRCDQEAWQERCTVWLYRGAWQEWPVDQIEMAVPLSPQEVQRKRVAIFKHESQKDHALFPGSDSREFWQRSEARTAETANTYDRLGLAEYEAIEGFVRWDGVSGVEV